MVVGPAEGLGTVVGRVDHKRIIGDAQVIELLEQLADLSVVLHHPIRVNAKAGLALRLGF